jgi:hypothetical protein
VFGVPPDAKTITLAGLQEGAVEERFQVALGKVLDNIADPNTEPEKARRITLTFIFSPDKERRHCALAIDVSEKLVGPEGLYTDVYLGKHEGRLAVVEGPTQGALFDKPAAGRPAVIEGGKA